MIRPTFWMLALLAVLSRSAPAQTPTQGTARDEGAATETKREAPDSRVDQILTDLQNRSDGLKDIRCKVKFVEDDRLNLSKRTKWGQILFMMADPNPNFLIHFEKSAVDGVLGKQEWYLFDGRWLYQVLERLRQVTKQEIARPGERKDFFDIEKAPFPLPFGQKKETILRNFDVTIVSPKDDAPPNTDHLVCVPKPESHVYRDYDKVEFFILRDVHLPSRVVVTKDDGLVVNTADFPDLSSKSINAGVSKKDFAKPKAWRGYEEVIEELPDGGPTP